MRCGLPAAQRLPALLLVFTGGGLGGLLYVARLAAGRAGARPAHGAFPFVEALANPHFVAGAPAARRARGLRGRPAWLGRALGAALGLVRPVRRGAAGRGRGRRDPVLAEPPRDWPRRLLPLAALVAACSPTRVGLHARPRASGALSSPHYAGVRDAGRPAARARARRASGADGARRLRRGDAAGTAHRLRLVLWACDRPPDRARCGPVSFSLQFLVGIGLPCSARGARPRALARARCRSPSRSWPRAPRRAWLCTLPGARAPTLRRALAGGARAAQGLPPGDCRWHREDIGLYVGGLTPCWPYVSHPAAPDYDGAREAVAALLRPALGAGRARALLARAAPATSCCRRPAAGWLAPTTALLAAAGAAARNRALAVWSRDPARPVLAAGPGRVSARMRRMSRDTARKVLEIEAEAIRELIPRLDESFDRAVETLLCCAGRVVATGMGKSGIIAQKISATLASTGTPSLFLHPAEAIHGDLGRIVKGDVLLAVSNSGDTEEILAPRALAQAASARRSSRSPATRARRSRRPPTCTSTSRSAPRPARSASRPTASTTAALAMGDALSMALLERRGFTVEDFAVLHPGGRLGKKLLRVEDVMHTGDDIPRVSPETPMKDVLFEMTRKRLGLTTVAEPDGTAARRDLGRRPAPPAGAPRLRAVRPARRRVHDAHARARGPPRAGDEGARHDGVAQDHLAGGGRTRERHGRGRPAPARPVEDGDDLRPRRDEGRGARRALPRAASCC